MRLFCSICKDIYIPNSEVFVTNCGHLYHGVCIKTWTERHRTCPQCRAGLTKPFRVYFDVEKDNTRDLSTLEHELEDVSDKLRELEGQKKALLEEQRISEERNEKLKERSEELKKKNNILSSSVVALKEEILKLTKKNKVIDLLESELAESKAKVSMLQRVENLIKCSEVEANKMLEATPVTVLAVQQLCTYVGVLKLQLDKYQSKNFVLSKQINEFHNRANEERLKYTSGANEAMKDLQLRNSILERELMCLKALQSKCTVKGRENKELPCTSSDTKTRAWLMNMGYLDDDDDDVSEEEEEDKCKNKNCNPVDRVINNWEEFVCAGPCRNFRGSVKKSRATLNCVKNFKSDELYAFDGLGGRKKIRLGGPTPVEEFQQIKKRKDSRQQTTFQHKKIFEYYQID